MNEIKPNEFAKLPHKQKQELLEQLPIDQGGGILDGLWGHEYELYIHGLIPGYCRSPYLKAGGEPEAIVLAGREGRLHGMEDIAGDPFRNYTSGSPVIIEAKIKLYAEAEYRYVVGLGWERQQELEVRHPSLSLDDFVAAPDGEYVSLHELVADPTEVGDPVGDMLEIEALEGALRKLTPDTRRIVKELLSGKELATIARERDQEYDTVQRRLTRAMQALREELSVVEMPGFDRDAAIADGYWRLLEKLLEDLPPVVKQLE